MLDRCYSEMVFFKFKLKFQCLKGIEIFWQWYSSFVVVCSVSFALRISSKWLLSDEILTSCGLDIYSQRSYRDNRAGSKSGLVWPDPPSSEETTAGRVAEGLLLKVCKCNLKVSSLTQLVRPSSEDVHPSMQSCPPVVSFGSMECLQSPAYAHAYFKLL